MTFLSVPLVILFYMIGGQTMKWIRPVGVALSLYGAYLASHLTHPLVGLPALLFGLELAFGYGENSFFSKIDNHNDEETRILYSIWCCLALVGTCIALGRWVELSGCLLIVGGFQVRAGAAPFKVFGKDFLYEDLARSLAIGVAMSWALL